MRETSSILFPTDFSEETEQAFRVAHSIAEKTGAGLCLVHAFPELDVDDRGLRAEVRRQQEERARKSVDTLLSSVSGAKVKVETLIRSGQDPEEVVLDEAAQRHADLIVLGAYGPGGRRTYDIGRTAHAVLRRAVCPVLTVHTTDSGREQIDRHSLFERVLIPTDFSRASRDSLNYAAGVCELFGAAALVLHVVEEFVAPGIYGIDSNPIREMSAMIEDRARAEMRRISVTFESRGVHVQHQIASGHAPSEIADFASSERADLIVIASRGSRLERFVIGTVADKVVRTAPCSVLTIKPSRHTAASEA